MVDTLIIYIFFKKKLNIKKKIMSISKKILIDELNEQMHSEKVEHVIFWALELYANNIASGLVSSAIAFSIIERIKERERIIKSESN